MISPRRRWRPFSRVQRASAQSALEQVGLWSRRHDRLDTLSGGQQRRVLIARALATGADLLVMDEPTAGVDTQHVAQLTELLAGLHRQGTTIIVVTHELTGIAHLITRAIVLGPDRRDSVVFDGPPPVPGFLLHDHVHHHEADGHNPNVVGLEP
jgi:zinc transport system ATP-binding protein